MLLAPLLLDALEPQALRMLPTEPAATPVSAVRRRNARRSKPGRSVSFPSEVLKTLYRFVCLIGV